MSLKAMKKRDRTCIWVKRHVSAHVQFIFSRESFETEMHLIKQMELVTGLRCVWLFSSVFEFSHGMREVLGSNHRSDHILFPHLCHLMAQCGPIFGQRAAKSLSPATAHVNP